MKYLKQVFILVGSTAVIGSVNADNVINDDLIVTFSACVGNDCNNGESFGFDTLRLKENNLRIHFDDTSNSASFPRNDWRLVANDTGNGGASHFSIEDSTAGRSPFRVEAGASANALVVEADSDIGIGTLNPVVELHLVDGDSPTLRLEQDGSSGFTPQTWDMASNETNFFIRDVTNSSTLSFRIFPGTENDDGVVIRGSNVGMGTDNPSADLHVVDNGAVQLRLQNTNTGSGGQAWNLNSAGDGGFRISDVDTVTANTEFALDADGNLTISGNLVTAGTVCSAGAAPGGCDYVFDSRYELDTIEEHAEKMWKNKFLPAVGQTIENAPFDITAKTGGILNELEKAHIYIDQLNQKIKERDDVLAELHDRLMKLENQQN